MDKRFLAIFILRRVLVLAVLLVVISFVIFSLLYISPGNVIDVLLGTNPRTPATVKALTDEYHLNRPFLVQYWIWFHQAIELKFGNSIQSGLPVSEEIRERLPTSVFLGVYAFILMMIFGVGGGILAALRRRTVIDRAVVALSIVGLSAPAFVTGIFLLYLFAILVHWFPAYGAGIGTGFFDKVWHLTLPALALALSTAAFVLKHTRSAMIGVLDSDYVVFACARGLSTRRVLFRYSLRNALIPVITISGLSLSGLIVGAVLVEVTFSISGVGSLLVNSAEAKDIPLLQGVALIIGVIIMGFNLFIDVVYMLADPRIRVGRRGAA